MWLGFWLSNRELYQQSRWLLITFVLIIAPVFQLSSKLFWDSNIGDFVWEDINSNGLQDSGEPGIGGILLILHTPTGEMPSTLTNSNGQYQFTVFPESDASEYYLSVDSASLLEQGYVIITKGSGDENQLLDSDFDQVSGQTDRFLLPPYGSYLHFDLGLVRIPQCQTSKDVVITLDASEDISFSTETGSNNFGLMTYFANAIARGFNISRFGTRVGVVQFGRVARTDIFLNQYPDGVILGRTIRAIQRMNIPKNPANILRGLQVAAQQLGYQVHPRYDVPQIIILVTDGNHNEPSISPVDTARGLHKQGVSIFVVKLNLDAAPQIQRDALKYTRDIASKPVSNYLFEDMGYQTDLIEVLIPLLNRVCAETSTTRIPIRNYYTTPQPTLTWGSPTNISLSDVISYEIQVSDNPNFNTTPVFSAVVPADPRTITLPPLQDSSYCWRVRPIFANGVGNWVVIDTFVIDAVP